MKDFKDMKYMPIVDKLVDILSARTQNPNRHFFVILVCYHLTKLASMMRASVDAKGLGNLLINFYGINLSPSGSGKGYSTKIIEEQVTNIFRSNYMEFTRPQLIENSLLELAIKRANRKGISHEEELVEVQKEFGRLGAYLTSFDSGTTPALKQFRHQLLMSRTGAINLEVDEMGSNLLSNKEILDTYLELYEGIVKPKLVKNTKDNIRDDEIVGKTPTNMLMFGTASSLLDGAQTEKMLWDLLLTGYARRCFFGFAPNDRKITRLSREERKKNLDNDSYDSDLATIAIKLGKLADPINHNFITTISDEVAQELIDYQIYCEELADNLKSTDEIRRAELLGRYYKTIKLAGAFAFLDTSSEIQLEHWESAVKVAEISSECFDRLLKTDPPHVRLAKYLSECTEPTTHADLVEELSFFPKASSNQKDLIKLAIAYGHKNNIIIKRTIQDDIDFIYGESLKPTNLDEIILSWTRDTFQGVSAGFNNEYKAKFSSLEKVTQLKDGHWCNHTFVDGIRKQTNAIRGFNLIVIDIDGGTPLAVAKEILKDYTYHIYTTKSHQQSKNGKPPADCYRIILPTNYILKLASEEFKEFMHNVFEFLPFESDEQTCQNNRKWLSNPSGSVVKNEGKLFNVLPFIPKTKKNEERKNELSNLGTLDKLEKYLVQSADEGNRNNTLFRYGAVLLDAGYGLDSLILKIKDFNSKLAKPIGDEELQNTVITSVTTKFYTR